MVLRRWAYTTTVATLLILLGLILSPLAVSAGTNEGRLSLSAGSDFTTAYYFRGIKQENDGFIAQPYGNLTINLYKGDKGLNSVSTTLGIWNSFQSKQTGATGDPKMWYESDLIGGFSVGFLDVFEFGTTFTYYTSPNGAFNDVQEFSLNLNFDDSKWLGPFALSPYVLVAFEKAGQADGGSNTGTYIELGVEPGFEPIKPLTVSFPLKLGLSGKDYYEDNSGHDKTFGYFDLGIAVSMPLAFIPKDFGEWAVSAAGHFLFLGDATKDFNSGNDTYQLAVFGLSLSY